MYCSVCGKEIMEGAVICIGCGCPVKKDVIKSNVSSGSTNKKTQISLILGIIGIVFAWLFALVGHVVSIIGIVLGSKEYKESGNMTGLILSIVGEACSVVSSAIGVIAFLGLL